MKNIKSMKFCFIYAITAFFSLTMCLNIYAQTPQFSDYSVSNIYTGKNAKVIITKDDRMFRTRLKQIGKESVNFAGHYILDFWGCGTTCIQGAIIDAKTGKVFALPFSICCWIDEPFEFKANSKLLIFHGLLNENEKRFGTYFYKFDNGKFTEIKYIPTKQK